MIITAAVTPPACGSLKYRPIAIRQKTPSHASESSIDQLDFNAMVRDASHTLEGGGAAGGANRGMAPAMSPRGGTIPNPPVPTAGGRAAGFGDTTHSVTCTAPSSSRTRSMIAHTPATPYTPTRATCARRTFAASSVLPRQRNTHGATTAATTANQNHAVVASEKGQITARAFAQFESGRGISHTGPNTPSARQLDAARWSITRELSPTSARERALTGVFSSICRQNRAGLAKRIMVPHQRAIQFVMDLAVDVVGGNGPRSTNQAGVLRLGSSTSTHSKSRPHSLQMP